MIMSAPSKVRTNSELRHWSHMFNEAGAFYISGEQYNMAFTEAEYDTVIEMWKEGRSVGDIVETLQRQGAEVAILIMDLVDRGILQDRGTGVEGATV